MSNISFINNYAVSVFTTDGQFVGNWKSSSVAAKALGIKYTGNIKSCLSGQRKQAYRYVWKYSPQPVPVLYNEEWKPVVGFESLYAVSNKGRVASLQYHGKYNFSLMTQSSVKGYPVVKIRNSKTGFAQSLKVHRLVAEAFIPNPEHKDCVDHIDTNTCNNNVENLRWVTSLENQRNPLTLARISNNMKSMNTNKIGSSISALNRSVAVRQVKDGITTEYKCA